VIPLALMLGIYLVGLGRVWSRAGRGHGVRIWQAASFFGGWLALFLALVSPLDALGTALFSAHMAQHLLLILFAAPLLVLSQPLAALTWALPVGWRRSLAHGALRAPVLRKFLRLLESPATAWILYAVALWVWHFPALYQAALRSETVHALEHLAFLGTAFLFWWVLFSSTAHDQGYGVAFLYVFTTSMHGTLLAVLITFASVPWYPAYRDLSTAWGLTPLADQQLAGAIMWVPATIVYAGITLGLLVLWLNAMERQALAREEQAMASTSRLAHAPGHAHEESS
jgi:putative membrane protein